MREQIKTKMLSESIEVTKLLENDLEVSCNNLEQLISDMILCGARECHEANLLRNQVM